MLKLKIENQRKIQVTLAPLTEDDDFLTQKHGISIN